MKHRPRRPLETLKRVPRPALPAPLLAAALCLWIVSCAGPPPACYSSRGPDKPRAKNLCHYPVARQGKLTAWLTSDHARQSGDWLYHPQDAAKKHRIVGVIPARAMPCASRHDGAFLLTADYDGPLYPLWEGREAVGEVYTGETGGWVRVRLNQEPDGVNTWLQLPPGMRVLGWSGYPIVIGPPSAPEAIAGAMWYKSNTDPRLGGAASTAMLRRRLEQLDFSRYIGKP